MRQKVLEVIDRYQMTGKGDTIYVAVSGGQDSIALLHCLHSIKEERQLKLGIIHVNHLLRAGDSDTDDFYVKQLAEKYKLPLHAEKVDVGEYARLKRMSIEEAARHCRYHAFTKAAKELHISKVAVAHTRDDNAETVLMRILRGTGLKGLRAIQPVLLYQGVTFIRPMIECSANDVKQYLREKRLKYRIDLSNRYIKFFRNKIRHELIPILEQDFNPRVREALARMAESVYSDYDFIKSLADKDYGTVIKEEKDQMIILDRRRFESYHDALRYRFMVRAIDKICPNEHFPFTHWSKIKRALEKGGNFTLFIGKSIVVEVRGANIVLKTKVKKNRYEYYIFNNEKLFIKECEMNLEVKQIEQVKQSNPQAKPDAFTELIDLDKLEFPLIIRNRKNGDRMEFLSPKRDKKIKDLLNDKKVPHYLRDEIPLIFSKRKLVWCWGVGSAEPFRPDSETKNVVQLSVKPKE